MQTSKRISLFEKKFGFEPQPFDLCPRFERCSCNVCPLHPDFNKLESVFEDRERKCKCPKSIRREIGLHFKLKNLGLTSREKTSQENWNNLTPEQKNEKIQKIRSLSPISRLIASGCKVIPPPKKLKQNTRQKAKTFENSAILQAGEVLQ